MGWSTASASSTGSLSRLDKLKATFDEKFINVLMLSFGSLLLFTAFQTTAIVQKTVMASIKAEDPEFNADGYTNLAIVYATYAVCNWFAPSVISVLTPKWTIVVAITPYLFFMGSFLMPSTALMYAISVLLGFGAALYWTSQGNILTLCSDKRTIVRNSGILVASMQTSLLFGNLFVFFEFQGQTIITPATRTKVFSCLVGVAFAAQVVFCHLKPVKDNFTNKLQDKRKVSNISTTSSISTISHSPSVDTLNKFDYLRADSSTNILAGIGRISDKGKVLPHGIDRQFSALAINVSSTIEEQPGDVKITPAGSEESGPIKKKRGPKEALVASFRLFTTPTMATLSGLFIYTGMALSFYSGVYSAAIGFTEQFGPDRTRFVGISGMLIGVGGMVGGVVIGAVGKKVSMAGRCWIVVIGAVIKLSTYAIVFVNIPRLAVFGHTSEPAYIESQIWLALLCSFLLGLGYSCYNTQIYALVGTIYSEDSAPGFALYKFVQSLAAAAAFFYTSHFNLHIQLVVLSTLCLIGTCSFWTVVRKHKN